MQTNYHDVFEGIIPCFDNDPDIGPNIVKQVTLKCSGPIFRPFPQDLHDCCVNYLHSAGINQLYIHQLKAWESIQKGDNIVISTGTASGKTFCYALPIITRALNCPGTTALFLYPTKALAQDQKKVFSSFEEFCSGEESKHIFSSIYDGDTPNHLRSIIRKNSRFLLTNPDMLHLGILPHHTLWEEYLSNLKFIVVDEIHILRGILGSHFANVIRRLKRILEFYGSKPQYCLTSATIANPVELAERIIEEKVVLINENGAPHGTKHFLLYNPPLVEQRLGIRKGSHTETIHLAQELITQTFQTLIFTRTRRQVELILRELQNLNPKAKDTIFGYRSGYLPSVRRNIEDSLKNGTAIIVAATNALELGIDIGGVDAVILQGYPGRIADTLQQAGRAGRKGGSSLAILVAGASPLDQYLMRHPEYFFEHSPENAYINPDNLLILLQHLRCAAFELPFQTGKTFGTLDQDLLDELLKYLVDEGVLHSSKNLFHWVAESYPATAVSLRSTSGSSVTLTISNGVHEETLGVVDQASSFWMVHPNAIYIHEGKTFRVKDLDLENQKALLEPVNVDYYTEAKAKTTIEVIDRRCHGSVRGGDIYFGEIQVDSQVVGYKSILWTSRAVLGDYPLDMPSTSLRTMAYWLTINASTIEFLRDEKGWKNDVNNYGKDWKKIRELIRKRDCYSCQVCGLPETTSEHHVHHKVPFKNFLDPSQANQVDNLITLCSTCHQKAELVVKMRSGLAGLSYALHNLAPLVLMCDVKDLGVLYDSTSPMEFGAPTIILYDMVSGGIGLSNSIYRNHNDMVSRAYELVNYCQCEDGCPGCTGPGGPYGNGGKMETIALINQLLPITS